MASPNSAKQIPEMQHVACNLCGAGDSRLIFEGTLDHHKGDWEVFRCTHPGYGHHLPVVECLYCRLRYANPRFTEEEILARYGDVQDVTYLEQLPGRLLTFNLRLKQLERFIGAPAGRKLLDVGAYTGACVRVAKERGWDAGGLEPSRWATEQAQRMGLDVRQGTIHTAPPAPESIDVLTSWDVVEHLADPLDEFRAFARALKPGGWAAIHTMDAKSPFARLMGKRWPWLMEMHLHYFSRRTLSAMLELAGFEVEQIHAESRYLRLNYLVTRMAPYSRFIADLLNRTIYALGIQERAVPVNFGDLMTVYARKR